MGNVIFLIFPIDPFAKRVSVYYIIVVVVCILLCYAEKEEGETEVVMD